MQRESAQWPVEEKKMRADAVIINDAGPETLQEQVDQLLAEWQLAREP